MLKTPAHNIIVPPKVGSSSVARAIIKQFYPDIEQKIQTARYPAGQGPNDKQWQGYVPQHDSEKPILMLVRNPVDRFRSAMAQFSLTDVDAVIDSIINDTKIQIPLPSNRTASVKNNLHFTTQASLLEGTTKLYQFPDQLEQFANEAGLDYPLLTINESSNPLPDITAEQETQLREIYADDLVMLESIAAPGDTYTIEPESVPAPRSISPRQLRLGLLGIGVTPAQVTLTLEAIEDVNERAAALVEWEYALDIRRDHPLVTSLGQSLGKTDHEIDQLFIEAEKI